MPRRFCAVCGKTTSELISGICINCYLSLYPLVKLKKTPSLTLCKNCLAYLYKGKWHHLREKELVSGIKETIIRSIKELIKPNRDAILKAVIPQISEEQVIKVINGRPIDVVVKVRGRPSTTINKIYEQILTVRLKANWNLCSSCKRVKSKVERAILQVRVLGRGLRDYEKRDIMKFISREMERLYDSDKEAVILDSDMKAGIDLHFSSRRVAKIIATAVQKKFGGKLLETRKVTGISRSGKTITKSTLRVMLPPFKPGDIILYKEKLFIVRKIHSNYFHAMSTESGIKEKISLSEAYSGKVKAIEPSELEIVSIISIKHPYVQVMNLRDYKVYEVRVTKIPKWIKEGTEVRLLKLGEKVYFVPP